MSVDVLTATVSNEVRAACKRHWGRGPQWAGVLHAGDDTVVVLLSGILTHAERSLLAVDHDRLVRSTRTALHQVLEPEIREIVEQYTGRQTEAVMSGVDLDCDAASIVVTLRRSERSQPVSVGDDPPCPADLPDDGGVWHDERIVIEGTETR